MAGNQSRACLLNLSVLCEWSPERVLFQTETLEICPECNLAFAGTPSSRETRNGQVLLTSPPGWQHYYCLAREAPPRSLWNLSRVSTSQGGRRVGYPPPLVDTSYSLAYSWVLILIAGFLAPCPNTFKPRSSGEGDLGLEFQA